MSISFIYIKFIALASIIVIVKIMVKFSSHLKITIRMYNAISLATLIINIFILCMCIYFNEHHKLQHFYVNFLFLNIVNLGFLFCLNTYFQHVYLNKKHKK